MKKVKIKFEDIERRILVKPLYEKRNELICEGRHTDANTTQAIYAHQIARARAEVSGVRAGVFSILKEA